MTNLPEDKTNAAQAGNHLSQTRRYGATLFHRHGLLTPGLLTLVLLAPSLCVAAPGDDADSAPQGAAATEAAHATQARNTTFGAGTTGTTVETSANVDPIPDDERTRALLARIAERWDLKKAGDFAAVYAFESPDYRARVDENSYTRRYGRFAKWFSAEPYRVRYDSADTAVALVDLALDTEVVNPLDDNRIRTTLGIQEAWVQVEGQWYHRTAEDTTAAQVEGLFQSSSAEPADQTASQSSSVNPPQPLQ